IWTMNTPITSQNKLILPSYQQALELMKQQLILKNYSRNTINTYLHMFARFLKYISPMPLHQVNILVIEKYHLQLIIKEGKSISFQNQSINTIKFYAEKVLNHPRAHYNLSRPKKALTLPKVLTLDEVNSILEATGNVK